MPASTIIAGLRQVLGEHLPFSAMASTDLDFVVENVDVAYFEPGEIIFAPSAGVPTHCVIVKQGLVQGESADSAAVAFEAGVGDCFPVGALLADRPATLTYRAVGDTFCLLLPRAKFAQLVQRSAVFFDFCTRRLGSMLDLARRQLQQSYASEASGEGTMATTLGELDRKSPLTCSPGTSLRETFERMQDAHVGSIVVVDTAPGGERVVGILTRTDLIGRLILSEVAPNGSGQRRDEQRRSDARCRRYCSRCDADDGCAFDSAYSYRPNNPRTAARDRRRVRARSVHITAARRTAVVGRNQTRYRYRCADRCCRRYPTAVAQFGGAGAWPPRI